MLDIINIIETQCTKSVLQLKITIHCMALKRNEMLLHAITWINFENIMLSERSQTQKDNYYMIPLI